MRHLPPRKLELHDVQAAFAGADAAVKGFVGGIGSGKSWAGAWDLLQHALAPGKLGRLYLVVAPTYRMLQDSTWRTLVKLARELRVLRVENKTDMRLTLSNGAEIIGRTADDPERLRGPNVSGVWLDEASLMQEPVLDICLGRLREAGEQGWLSATFTPRGRRHWTYRFFAESGQAVLFHCPTAGNPFLPRGFTGRLESRYNPQFARQELGGEFVEIAGSEFPAAWFEDAWFDRWPAAEGTVLKTMALDPSKGRSDKHGDYSACVRLAIDRHDVLHVAADMARRPVTQMIADCVALYREFQPHAFAVEGNAWQDLLAPDFAEEFRRQGVLAPDVWVMNNQVNKLVRIRRLAGYLSAGRVRFLSGCDGTRLLVDQLLDFPVGPHDDGPDAFEMAVRLAEQLAG